MKIYFVDDRPFEISRLWDKSGCGCEHELLPLEMFESTEVCLKNISRFKPDAIIVGYGLGANKPDGAEVIKHILADGFQGYILTNSGGGQSQFERNGIETDADVSRDSDKLKEALSSLQTRR